MTMIKKWKTNQVKETANLQQKSLSLQVNIICKYERFIWKY